MKVNVNLEIDTRVLRQSMLLNYPSKENEIKEMNEDMLVDFFIERKLKQHGCEEIK